MVVRINADNALIIAAVVGSVGLTVPLGIVGRTDKPATAMQRPVSVMNLDDGNLACCAAMERAYIHGHWITSSLTIYVELSSMRELATL